MANELQKLQRLESYSASIRSTCARIADSPPPSLSPEARDWVGRILKLATECEEMARSPVKIGVVGEFSAGKTLLLGALIGYADGLPVEERPMTGNVTSLHFELFDELLTTEVGPFEVEFLDHDGFADCLEFMLGEARQRALVAQIRTDLRQRLDGFDPRKPEETLSKLELWSREVWPACTNPGFRYLLRELLAFTRAYRQCGMGLCGAAFEVSAAAARDGLSLTEPPRDIQSLAFEDLPPPPLPISSRPEELNEQLLRAAFPLIRRVNVRVRLSRQIWDFSELVGTNPFVLLDFPGLGAVNSGVRDLYLCLRELAGVQTILILLDANKPGGSQGAGLYDLLQRNRPGQDIRDAVLVGVGRFDKLPLGHEGTSELEKVAGVGSSPQSKARRAPVFHDEEEDDGDASAPSRSPANGRISEDDLLQRVKILNTCVSGAESIVREGRKDRIVFLSPLLHLQRLGDQYGGIQVGSPKFVEHLTVDVEPAVALQKLWKGATSRLERDAPGSRTRPGLTRWLDDFADDGGVGRLRQLIQSHVQAHGLSQLLDAVVKKANELRGALKSLAELVEPVGSDRDLRLPGDRVEKLEKRFQHLYEYYRRLEQQVKNAPTLRVRRNGRDIEVNEVIHEEVVSQVFDWGQWERLLSACRNGHIVEPRLSAAIFKDDEIEEQEADDTSGTFPVSSDDFYSAFDHTVDIVQGVVREQVVLGVRGWLNGLAGELASVREELDPHLADAGLTKRLKALRLSEQGKGLVPALRYAANPSLFEGLIFPEGDPDNLELPAPKATDLFPLPRKGGAAGAGMVFAWARQLQEGSEDSRPEPHCSHQSQVLRLRDEFITSITQEMTQIVGVATYKINKRVEEILRAVNEKLALVSSRPDILTEMVRSGTAESENVEQTEIDPLELVRQLAGTTWPLKGDPLA